MTAFADGLLRGLLAGAIALFIGLGGAQIARFTGLPPAWTVILGFWAMVVAFGLLRPAEDRT